MAGRLNKAIKTTSIKGGQDTCIASYYLPIAIVEKVLNLMEYLMAKLNRQANARYILTNCEPRRRDVLLCELVL